MTMAATGPSVTLNNGVKMPMLGLGTYLSDETADVVAFAIDKGYRLFDTASFYQNERQVGEGIRKSGINRAEVFVTSKLWFTDFGYERAMRAFDVTMYELGMEYIDLFLLHWPTPANFWASAESYKALEKLLSEKRVRAIGVSNFNPEHLRMLMENAHVVPAVNQVEIHPLFTQPKVREFNAHMGIVTQSWSPIGGIFTNHPSDPGAPTRLLDHPGLAQLAKKYGKTPAQVTLRWHIQHGLSVIPKSGNPMRIIENADIFNFAITYEDMKMIDGFDIGARGGGDPETFAQGMI